VTARSVAGVGRLLAVLPILAVICIRVAYPSDPDLDGQSLNALYVLDIVEHGNWVLPQLQATRPIDSPPLYAWLAAAPASLAGLDLNLATRAPSIIAAIALVLLLYQLGLEWCGMAAGVAAAWMFSLSGTAFQLSAQAQPAPLIALLGVVVWFALHLARRDRLPSATRMFWLAFSLMLAAGGIGASAVALCTLGLLALSREGRAVLRPLLASRWSACVLIPLSWILAAYIVGGSAYVREELVPALAQSLPLHGGTTEGPTLSSGLLTRLSPWVIIAALGPIGFLIAERRRALAGESSGSASTAGELALPLAAFWSALLLLRITPTAGPGQSIPLLFSAASAWLATVVLMRLPDEFAFGALRWLHGPRRVQLAGLLCMILLLSAAPLIAGPRPDAGGGPNEFTRQVLARTQPNDRLRILEGTRASVFFLLRHSDPALTVEDLDAFRQWAPAGGRPLIVSSRRALSELDLRWPGRFQLVFGEGETDQDRDPTGLVLFEVLPTRSKGDPAGIPWAT